MKIFTRYRLIILLTIVLLTVFSVIYFFTVRKNTVKSNTPKTITDERTSYPTIRSVTTLDGRVLLSRGEPVPLVPKSNAEKIIVQNAIWTMKDGYEHVVKETQEWASDAKLVYARSLGSVSVDGKSSVWQYAFTSKSKKSGREVIVEGDTVASRKDAPTSSSGFPLPNNWYDSSDAIVSLQSLPQFSSATLSAISFYANEDSRVWEYALVTSHGTVSMPVK